MNKNLYAIVSGLFLFAQTAQSFAKPPEDHDHPQWSQPKISASGKSLSIELKLPAAAQSEELLNAGCAALKLCAGQSRP
ncbi:MAG: hypothetical protein PHD48_04830 [Alphaproteobacteria bacterium]|nr:hypothetical protein [Alphaproteobacteria bacterium]